MKVEITNDQMTRLVDEVVAQVKQQLGNGASAPDLTRSAPPRATFATVPASAPVAASAHSDGVFADVDQAIAAAQRSFDELQGCTLSDRQAMVSAMRQAAVREAERLARFAVEETGLGRVSAKVQKILLAARKTPGTEDLTPVAYTGDDGLSLVEPAPFGVAGVITPSTNPPSTVVNNAICMVAAGNTAVFNPHPSAKGVSNEVVRVLNRAILEAGGPANVLCSVASPTLESSQALMQHPAIRLLLVTGGGIVVKLAMTSGKKAVAAGPGNPPVIVDDTASLSHAARHIVDGASFDNNVLCIGEKEVFVFRNVADRFKEEMRRAGAFEVTGADRDRLVERCLDLSQPDHPVAARDLVGKDAHLLLAEVGLTAPPDTRLIFCEVDDLYHPLIQAEQLMPFLPILRVDGLDEALACAKQAEHGFRHTATMHSENVVSMSRVAREIETTIFVKNAPSYAGLGFGGEGFTTLSIAGPTGEGLTSPRTFTRQRRCVLAGSFRIV